MSVYLNIYILGRCEASWGEPERVYNFWDTDVAKISKIAVDLLAFLQIY